MKKPFSSDDRRMLYVESEKTDKKKHNKTKYIYCRKMRLVKIKKSMQAAVLQILFLLFFASRGVLYFAGQ